MRGGTAAALLGLLLLAPAAVTADSYTLIVSGASGGAEYADRYGRWRRELVTALRREPGFRADHLVVLAERPDDETGLASAAGVRAAFDRLRRRLDARSTLWVVLLGHGTYDGEDAKFNLVGPDLTAADWAALVDTMPGRLVFLNTTAASFPFLAALAGDDRVVITATSSAAQRYDTMFAEFMTRAMSDPAADLDKNGRRAAWELFAFTSDAVRRWYQRAGRLATERPRLDDTGEGVGVTADERESGGGLATVVEVGAGVDLPAAPHDPGDAALAARRRELERHIAELRAGRPAAPPARYARELERLLLELARVSRALRESGDRR